MTLGSSIIVLFIFLLTGLLVLRPILVGSEDQDNAGTAEYDSLLAEKERLYAAIEDLDLNFELKKVSQEEHGQARQELLNQAAAVLKELDAHPSNSPRKAKHDLLSKDDKLEKMIAARREKIQGLQRLLCPGCGEPVTEGDQFCSHCGEKL